MIAALLLAATIQWHATLPTTLAGGPRCSNDTTHAHSWMRLELWFQKQSPAWWPPFWPHYAPQFVAASRDSSPGAQVFIALPDTFSYGTMIPRARNAAGLNCDGNYYPSRTR